MEGDPTSRSRPGKKVGKMSLNEWLQWYFIRCLVLAVSIDRRKKKVGR